MYRGNRTENKNKYFYDLFDMVFQRLRNNKSLNKKMQFGIFIHKGVCVQGLDIPMDWTIWKTVDPITTKTNKAKISGDTG